MIGKKVSSMCLDDAELNFYRWDGELSDLLGKVVASLISDQPAVTGLSAYNQEPTDALSWLIPCTRHLCSLHDGVLPLQVKDELNDIADTWTEEQKAHCLDETTKSFEVSYTCLHTAFACHQKVQAGQ